MRQTTEIRSAATNKRCNSLSLGSERAFDQTKIQGSLFDVFDAGDVELELEVRFGTRCDQVIHPNLETLGLQHYTPLFPRRLLLSASHQLHRVLIQTGKARAKCQDRTV